MVDEPVIVKKPRRKKKPGRILIVDDESDIREMLNLFIQKEGFKTELAESGSDFLEKVDSFNPDIVTLDVMMPGLTTKEILQKLGKKKRDPKIILLTAVQFSNNEKEKLFKMGNIVEYITKPFNWDDFNDAVKKHV